MQEIKHTEVYNFDVKKFSHKFLKIGTNSVGSLIISIGGETITQNINELTISENSVGRLAPNGVETIWFSETEKLTFPYNVYCAGNWVYNISTKTLYYSTKHKVHIPEEYRPQRYFENMVVFSDGIEICLLVIFNNDNLQIIEREQNKGWEIINRKLAYNGIVYDKEVQILKHRSEKFAVAEEYDPITGSNICEILEHDNGKIICRGVETTELQRFTKSINDITELLLKNAEFAKFIESQQSHIDFALKYGKANMDELMLALYNDYYK